MDANIIDQQNRFEPSKGVIPTLSPLNIDVDDDKLLKYIKGLEEQSKAHWNKKDGINLEARRKQNFKYRMGRQLIGLNLKEYESEYLDNIIGESENILKALATSKLPDYIIEAGGIGTSEARRLTAELLTKVINKEIDSDKVKADLGMMFKLMPLQFIAGKKYRWDASKDGIGDYVEEVLNMDNVLLDHTAVSSNPDEMLYVIHYVEKTAKEWSMLFPQKEKEILEHVEKAHPDWKGVKEKEDVLMAQKVKVAECWYDWFDKAEDFDPEANPKFNFTCGVAWMLSDTVLLGKSKNPNWDYEGHDVPMMNGQPVSPQDMETVLQAQMMGQEVPGFEIKRVFNNYFKYPRKPFIFMTFEQFLRSAIDETSRVEQQIPIQKSMDSVERQTDHMVMNHKGKHIWSADSGMTKKDLKKVDLNNPNVDLQGVKGDLDKVHKYLQPEMPPGEMFAHIAARRDRMFAKVGANAVRGDLQTDVATSNQIAREANFTLNDDLVNSTILPVATESIKARMHIMKLRYTEKHFTRIAGIDEGKYLHLRLTNDSIDDDMEVVVKASTVDKLRAERNAQNMASAGLIDPYYFYKDMGIPDAEGRAEALFLFQSNPALWYQKVVKGKDVSALAQQVMGSIPASAPTQPPIQGAAGAAQQALAAGGVQGAAASLPSPADTTNIPTAPAATPQGSPRGLMGRIGSAIGGALFQPQI